MQLRKIASQVAAVVFAVGAVGCGGAELPTGDDASFSGEPFASIASRSGALHIALRAHPAVPVAGTNALELTVTDDRGAPMEGLGATVVPWMPAHGHGTSVVPEVRSVGHGVFVAEPVFLQMPGIWELRIGIEGSVEDAAATTIDVR